MSPSNKPPRVEVQQVCVCLNSVKLPGVRVYMRVSKIGNLLKFCKRHFNFAKLSFIGGHLFWKVRNQFVIRTFLFIYFVGGVSKIKIRELTFVPFNQIQTL